MLHGLSSYKLIIFTIKHKAGVHNVVVDAHGGALEGHFERNKTLALVQSNFHWPMMKREVDRHVKQCRICDLGKTKSQNNGLYTPLPVPKAPWEDVSLDL